MAVPTHSNNKSTSVESMGVPVLFSIKNVQPLILAAKPTAELSDVPGSAPTYTSTEASLHSVAQTVASTAIGVVDTQPKARRTGMLSKAIATGFVVMLVVVVIRFSVPGSKPSTDIAESGRQNNSESSESVVTGPESNASSDGTRVASLPITSEFNLGTVENKSDIPAPTVPVLPPLLSASSTNPSANNLAAPSHISLQPPVVSQGTPVGVTSTGSGDSSDLQTLEIPSSTPMIDLSQQSISNQVDGTNSVQPPDRSHELSGHTDNLHILETLTPERSLADFEWLFRNATKNPMIPYRPVSAGGHEVDASQQVSEGISTFPSNGFNTSTVTDQKAPPAGPTAYQPLTIPSAEAVPPYEKNLSNQSVNRYQQRIKQPPKTSLPETSKTETSTAPAPYQPLVIPGMPQPGASGTSYGYPPVQYSPTQNGSVPNNPSQR